MKNSLFLYLVLCARARARIKLNRETKNFSRYACNLHLMETTLHSKLFSCCVVLGVVCSSLHVPYTVLFSFIMVICEQFQQESFAFFLFMLGQFFLFQIQAFSLLSY